MTNQLLLTTKSIMYKIISLDCAVYTDDWDDFTVCCLVCADCKRPWNNSRTECFFCGTKNFHVYKCENCGKLISLTNAQSKCDCGGKLSKVCLNGECVTNTDEKLKHFIYNKGGVFEKSKAAAMLNEMRCKMCGCKSSIYLSKKFKIVESLKVEHNQLDVVYLKKNNESDFEVKFNGHKKQFETIGDIVEEYLGINFDQD